MHEDTCRATAVRHDQPGDVLDLRMQCLDERLVELETMAALFAKPDAALVERAVQLSARLSPVASCADVANLRAANPIPANPQIRADVAALSDLLAKIRVLERADRFADARPQIEHVVARAAVVGYAPVEAEARYLAGSIARRDGDLPGGATHLRAAVLSAEAGRADVVRASALTDLVTLNTTLAHYSEAHDFAQQAAATVTRLGGGGRPHARLEVALGGLVDQEGKQTEALTHYQAALAAYRHETGSLDDFDVAATLETIGSLEIYLGQHQGAETHLREAHDMMVRLVGDDHGHVAFILSQLAEALLRQDKADEAKRVLESGLAIAERAHAPAGSIALFLNGLGSLALENDKAAEGLPYLDRAYQLLAARNPKANVLLNTLRLQGETLLVLKRYAEALAKFEATRSFIIAKKGADSPDLGFVEEAEAAVFRDQGNHAHAVSALERALALRKGEPGLAGTRFFLAQELWRAGNRPRARTIAEAARAAFIAADQREDADNVTTWLKEQR